MSIRTQFNPNNAAELFLTRDEQQCLSSLPPKLRSYAQTAFLRVSNEELYLLQTLLKTAALLSDSFPKEDFLLPLIKQPTKEAQKSLSLLLSICSKETKALFFDLAKADKTPYYSLEEIQNLMKEFCVVPSNRFQTLRSLPAYDNGGKELLRALKEGASVQSHRESVSHLRQIAPTSERLEELVAFEGRFTQLKREVVSYLSSLTESNRLPMTRCHIFLQSLERNSILDSESKCTLIKLFCLLTTHPTQKDIIPYLKEDLSSLLLEAQEAFESWGAEGLSALLKARGLNHQTGLCDVLRYLRFLKQLQSSGCSAIERLATGNHTLNAFLAELELKEEAPQEPFPFPDMDLLKRRFSGEDPNVVFCLDEGRRELLFSQYQQVLNKCNEWRSLRLHELAREARTTVAAEDVQSDEKQFKLVAIGVLAFKRFFRITLHPSQVLSALGVLMHEKGALAQVKTGEGKSFIVTLIAFVLSMQQQRIHIVSSSRLLASRDQREFSSFFAAFGVLSSSIAKDNPEEKRFKGQILYGMAHDFAFGVMREMLYFSSLFEGKHEGAKPFDVVLVDEVDNLMIDTSRSGARLSYPAESTVDWVYSPIYDFVSNHVEEDADNLSEYLPSLKTHLSNFNERKYAEEVNTLSDEELVDWLKSAKKAHFELKNEIDYILLPDEEEIMRIKIVDQENTGTIQYASRWGQGLHEFVEAKHRVPIMRESLAPISIPNSVYYSFYQKIYGLTGTLGSLEERKEIHDLYGIEGFDVPTHRPPQRVDHPPTFVRTREEWLNGVIDRVQATVINRRPLLILCDNIQESTNLSEKLQEHNLPHQLFNELQEESPEEILARAGNPGSVTIATNNAGRGTDIKPTQEALDNGGLEVLMLFYPSTRVEGQGRGRAGRQGQPGSSSIFLYKEKFTQEEISDEGLLEQLSNQRRMRISASKEIHKVYAIFERDLYNYVVQFFSCLGRFQKTNQREDLRKERAKILAARRFLSSYQAPSNTSTRDTALLTEIAALLTGPKQDRKVDNWTLLLKQIGDRVIEKTIEIWCKTFYQKREKALQNSSLFTAARLLGRLRTIKLDNADDALRVQLLQLISQQSLMEELNQLQTGTRVLFEAQRQAWENRFRETGKGYSLYLREVTKKPLKGLKPKS